MTLSLYPWQGGKVKMIKRLLPLIPAHDVYIEAFLGGGSVFLNKPLANKSVINDLEIDIVCLFRCIKYHLDALKNEMRYLVASRIHFEALKKTNPETLTDIQRAVRFFYLQKLCFSGKVNHKNYRNFSNGCMRIIQDRLYKKLDTVHYKLKDTTIENNHFETTITAHDSKNSFFYCDPPYWRCIKYGFDFPWQEHQKLADLTKTLKGKILISLNDHPDIRNLYSHLNINAINQYYSISKNSSTATELLIKNY